MKYVIGIDLGTSAVKVLVLDQEGMIRYEASRSYPLIQEQSGYSEQDPEEWVKKTILALQDIASQMGHEVQNIEGISFSGHMHGLVLVDQHYRLLRNCIMWNDTRTTEQCQLIYDLVGEEKLLQITKNPALEGFTLPKLLWVKQNEPDIYEKASVFMLPKDYLRYRMTGEIYSDYSDAAGTLLLDVAKKKWSTLICELVEVPLTLCPPLIDSFACVGTLTKAFAEETGLPQEMKVFAGGADNACGAIGAGILSEGKTLCSIGTSGVILSYEENKDLDFGGKVHYFNHGKQDAFYTMGVTLAAGYSLSWFKDTFATSEDFDSLLADVHEVPIGANGLLFTPYLVGERTPHADATIRASFLGMDASHKRIDFVRAVMEGITFSLNESIDIFRQSGKEIGSIVSIGGGAKSDVWLQMQADIFNAKITLLSSEQGPAMGAAILAAYGSKWFSSLQECADRFLSTVKTIEPIEENVTRYQELYQVYKKVYAQTKEVNVELQKYRR